MTQRSGKWCYPREGVYMGTGSLGDWYAVNLANKPGTNHIKELQSDHKSKGYHKSMGCDDPKKVGDQVRSLDLTKVRRATTRPRGEIYRLQLDTLQHLATHSWLDLTVDESMKTAPAAREALVRMIVFPRTSAESMH